MSFTVHGINHIGIAPKDPEKARWFFGLLGLTHVGDELVEAQKTMTRMYQSHSQAGGPRQERLEILEPDSGEGPIAKYMEKKGGGIHHIALTVDDVAAAIQHLLAHDVEMVDTEPRGGAHKTRIAFVHPRSTGGLLIELVQEA